MPPQNQWLNRALLFIWWMTCSGDLFHKTLLFLFFCPLILPNLGDNLCVSSYVYEQYGFVNTWFQFLILQSNRRSFCWVLAIRVVICKWFWDLLLHLHSSLDQIFYTLRYLDFLAVGKDKLFFQNNFCVANPPSLWRQICMVNSFITWESKRAKPDADKFNNYYSEYWKCHLASRIFFSWTCLMLVFQKIPRFQTFTLLLAVLLWTCPFPLLFELTIGLEEMVTFFKKTGKKKAILEMCVETGIMPEIWHLK